MTDPNDEWLRTHLGRVISTFGASFMEAIEVGPPNLPHRFALNVMASLGASFAGSAVQSGMDEATLATLRAELMDAIGEGFDAELRGETETPSARQEDPH